MRNFFVLLLLLLTFIGIVIVSSAGGISKLQDLKTVSPTQPIAHDSQGNIVNSDKKKIQSSPNEFTNKKYLYKVTYLPESVQITTDTTQNYAKDSFFSGCLMTVNVIPENLVNSSLDEKLLFPISRIKTLTSLSIGAVEKIQTGQKVESTNIVYTYTRLADSYLGNQTAYVFEFGSNWEMLASTRIFYTKHNRNHYIVSASYGDYCPDSEALNLVGNIQLFDNE